MLLSGRALADYVLWRSEINDVEGREWDAFVAALTPDNQLSRAKLNGFRFSTTPPDDDVDPRVQTIIGVILNPPSAE